MVDSFFESLGGATIAQKQSVNRNFQKKWNIQSEMPFSRFKKGLKHSFETFINGHCKNPWYKLAMKGIKHTEHLVLRARLPVLRLRQNRALISQLLFNVSEKFQVKVYNNSLNSNHIHLLVKAPTQKSLHNFLRVLTGQIAQRITGAVRGKKNKFSFWLRPAWKRIVH